MTLGKLFLILGPSGSGKGTVIECLRKKFPSAVFPVSCTTRQPRPGEKDGDVYNFVSKEEFKRRIDAGEFLEWAIVHNDNYYGTLKDPIKIALESGKKVIREVDVQGVESIQKIFPSEQIISIFITTPSWETLKSRILRRSQLPEDEISARKKSFEKEMEFATKCNHVVQSEEGRIRECCEEVTKIIEKY